MDIIMLACPSEQKVHSLGSGVWNRHLPVLPPWHMKREVLITADPECLKCTDKARKEIWTEEIKNPGTYHQK